MRLLVTGAKGMLGHRVVAVAQEQGHEVFATDLPDLDLTDAQAVFDYIGEVQPDATIHCAAYTDVDGAEANVELADIQAEGIHHLTGGGQCTWSDLAAEVFRVAGLDTRVVPVSTAEFPRPAPRPAWSVLDSEREDTIRLPPWQEHVAAYLGERS